MNDHPVPRGAVEAAPRRHIDQVCDRFESVWKAGLAPRIEDFLAEVAEAARSLLVRELVLLDVAYRIALREDLQPHGYLARFPGLDWDWVACAIVREQNAPSKLNTVGPIPPLPDLAPPVPPPPKRPAPLGPQQVRCPHCHNPMQLGASWSDEVLCPGCGSNFRLRDARQTTSVTPLRVGRFELLERVGLGAFGAVWRARDTELNRIVALKIPHSGLGIAEEELQRFHDEARKVAQLRHPGIVPVHEVTTLQGLPVIVSDFIQGAPLNDLLEVRRLTAREAATLMAAVSDALDYAHNRGLVHRDIKPANLMVEYVSSGSGPVAPDLGKPLILDFGLALQAEAPVTLTLDGQLIGTPAYMSPEQAAGKGHQADRRSDVFCLGIVLYELLCGELPFRGSRQMLLLQILCDDPKPPRRINDKIARDLETICLKCLHKDPSGRYQTAAALADDLRRFLRGEPIQARPISSLERLWRWCGRNPRVAMLAATVVALLVLVAVGSTTAAVLIDRQSRRAEENAKRAQEHFRDTLQAVDLLTASLDNLLEEIPALEEQQQEYLKKIQPLLAELLKQKPKVPRMREQLALALYRVGKLLGKIGVDRHSGEAEEAFTRSVEEFKKLTETFPEEPRYEFCLARCLNHYSQFLRATTRDKEAREGYDTALLRLRPLVEKAPKNQAYRQELAEILNNLGVLLERTNNRADAIKCYHEAIEHLEALRKRFPQEPTFRADLARVYLNLGVTREHQGRLADAERHSRQAIGLLDELCKHFPAGPDRRHRLASACMNLSTVLSKLPGPVESVADRHRRAAVAFVDPYKVGALQHRSSLPVWQRLLRPMENEQRLREAIAIYRRLHTDFPGYHIYQYQLSFALRNLGLFLTSRNPKEAKSILEEACKHGERPAEMGNRHDYKANLAYIFFVRAWLSLSQGRRSLDEAELDEARSYLEKAIKQQGAALKLNPTNPRYLQVLGILYRNLVTTWVLLGNQKEADRVVDRLFEEPLLPRSPKQPYQNACFLARCVGDAQEADKRSGGKHQEVADSFTRRTLELLAELVAKGEVKKNMLEKEKAFDSIRNDPRFKELLE